MQRKKSNTSITNTDNLKLSIQFSLDGFSFCILDTTKNETVFFTSYVFDNRLKNPEELLTEITSIFKSDKNLHLDFKSVAVIHRNNLNTLVPKTYFDEENLKNYLDFNIKRLQTDFVAFDELNQVDANNIYVPYVNINNYLFQHFGAFEYKHHLSIFIDKLISKNSEKSKKAMFVNVAKTTFDVVVLENKNLLLANIFSYKTKEDFLYYILFVAEQLKLNPEEFPVYFSGNITAQSEIYKICYEYIRNIFFNESPNAIFSKLESPKHSNFILLD